MALRTPVLTLNCWVVAARKTRAKQDQASFQSGETSSIPGACVPRARVEVLRKIRLIPGWFLVP
jgi:hypothetical protein